MTSQTRQDTADQIAAELGHRFDGDIRIGGHYASAVSDGRTVYLSGQVPRVGDKVMVTGRVGAETTLDQARTAAMICTLRALAILRQALGSLDVVDKILRVTVFMQTTPDFTQQSEVADAASDLLYRVFGEQGVHTRTSVGVYSLPKNASVELDMVVSRRED
ncbi:RidA family protein [Variovorax sp. GT1P44]|uniref:RidA family protein n=1 Tax=Variovorax sp. GT1P44 TaxID=3443742 RepID=UPI003F484675